MLDRNPNTESSSDVLHDLDVQAKQRFLDTEDFRLEGLMEDVFAGGYEADSYELTEPYEPNVYDGTYSEE
jgi:hypothetical protein